MPNPEDAMTTTVSDLARMMGVSETAAAGFVQMIGARMNKGMTMEEAIISAQKDVESFTLRAADRIINEDGYAQRMALHFYDDLRAAA